MNPALRAFLGGIIDYAGLFPPAQLSLEKGIHNYARYRTEPESWMLGRFVVPAAKLGELASIGKELFRGAEPFRLSVVGRSGKNEADLLSGVSADLGDIRGFQLEAGFNATVDAYEMKLPAAARTDTEIAHLVAATLGIIRRETRHGDVITSEEVEGDEDFENWSYQSTAFFEPPTIELVQLNALPRVLAKNQRSGFKLRTGGLEAAAFPSVEQVARTLAACKSAGIPFKATAGLHHPIRRFDRSVQTKMHGFLNVFGAGCLAFANELSEATLQEIIADEDVRHFSIDEDGLRWKNLRAAPRDIANARQTFVTSFGSCSFDEPREDLRAMKWL